MRLFTFIIIAYNEEPYILEALESIRYQIEHFGNGRCYQLIITDDKSEDRTRDLIDYWISMNERSFVLINKLYREQNVGISRNVADALSMVAGDSFYSLAGDDMLSPIDIVSELEANKGIDILASVPAVLISGAIQLKREVYYDSLAQSLYTSEYIKWAVGLGCPLQSGVAWKKSKTTTRVLNYMCRYRLLDDRTRFYAIWKYESPVSYGFVNKPFLIYRRNNQSASCMNGNHRSELNEELQNFFEDVAKESDNILYAMLARIQAFSARMRGFSVIRYLTPYYFIEFLLRLINIRKMNNLYRDYYREYINSIQTFVFSIHNSAEKIKCQFEGYDGKHSSKHLQFV